MTGGAYAAKKYLITNTNTSARACSSSSRARRGRPERPALRARRARRSQRRKRRGRCERQQRQRWRKRGLRRSEVGETACGKLGGSKFTVGGKETTACNGKEGKKAKKEAPGRRMARSPKKRPRRAPGRSVPTTGQGTSRMWPSPPSRFLLPRRLTRRTSTTSTTPEKEVIFDVPRNRRKRRSDADPPVRRRDRSDCVERRKPAGEVGQSLRLRVAIENFQLIRLPSKRPAGSAERALPARLSSSTSSPPLDGAGAPGR